MKPSLQQEVWERARARCEYCRMPQQYHPLPFHVDHIIAQKHRGPTTGDNLALACYDCNQHKGPNVAGVDPQSSHITRLFHPRQDGWREHFQWDGAVLIGQTAIGRVTVDVLRINAPVRVEHRRMLVALGVFPPQSVEQREEP